MIVFLLGLEIELFYLSRSWDVVEHDITKTANTWTVSMVCPTMTVSAERGLVPIPLFYARA